MFQSFFVLSVRVVVIRWRRQVCMQAARVWLKSLLDPLPGTLPSLAAAHTEERAGAAVLAPGTAAAAAALDKLA
jgi:hypothetical protein